MLLEPQRQDVLNELLQKPYCQNPELERLDLFLELNQVSIFDVLIQAQAFYQIRQDLKEVFQHHLGEGPY